MSKNWGGYSERIPLFENLLHWPPSTSLLGVPKFQSRDLANHRSSEIAQSHSRLGFTPQSLHPGEEFSHRRLAASLHFTEVGRSLARQSPANANVSGREFHQ